MAEQENGKGEGHETASTPRRVPRTKDKDPLPRRRAFDKEQPLLPC